MPSYAKSLKVNKCFIERKNAINKGEFEDGKNYVYMPR